MGSKDKVYLDINYEDSYVQPLLVAALKARLPPELVIFIDETWSTTPPNTRYLQWRQYESIDFESLLKHPQTRIANSHVIRKALIRKHYFSTTVSYWLTKHPESVLKQHVKPSVEFEVDYAEFLDDALVEAFELKESWERNEPKDEAEKEWWILKPGMSERGQGIRLFKSAQELTAIFEEWDPPPDDEENGDDDTAANGAAPAVGIAKLKLEDDEKNAGNGVVTSQLRHFIAQPYIDPPLLLPPPHPSAGRKFHIRTYVLAVGALKVYVYRPMLALFAGQPYTAPGSNDENDINDELNAHLTNTCLQPGEREGSVLPFWSLPNDLPNLPGRIWKDEVFKQICGTTGEAFEAAARSMSIHFQPLPNAFEIFGLDFLVDADGDSWLLEVNAFPDFAQTGVELQGLIRGLFEGVVDKAVKPLFGIGTEGEAVDEGEDMVHVLNIDLGKR